MSDSLRRNGLQHTRLSYPSPTPGAYSNYCSLSQWCHPTISSSVNPFSSCLPSFPASGSFPMSQFFTSEGQSIRASASVLPMNIQDWSPLRWTGWISLKSKGLSRVFSNTTVQKHQFFSTQPFLWSNSHIYWKDRLLISWLQSPYAVILEPRKIKLATVSTVSPSICHEVMGPNVMLLAFWVLSCKPLFHSPLSLSSRSFLVPLRFVPWGWYHLHIWGCWYFSQQSWFQLVTHPAQYFTV